MKVTRKPPSSVLFCCDHNAVRSPMAEGLMKRLYGRQAYVQSAGVKNDREIDGFTVAVCKELGIELSRHRSRSFEEMMDWGDDLSGFDLIVALSPASQRMALELTRYYHLDVEYWPIMDPTGLGEGREQKLAVYRQVRDQIRDRMVARFGPPAEQQEKAGNGS
ncbi:low molecular weight phosphatase family protein [Rhodobacter sp. CZR27]|uniref:arsenate-mycothiol transferase ArsC n=1 Tax=Rhodobacter sp. CZR27 TaxID=2033869 RepID=UPI000BBE4A96|nr:low molecular weight phosphatase family protein [Rhodobacter sp. CZR27]